MRIAVTSQGTDLTSRADPRFGRAAYFLVFDTTDESLEVVENSQNVNAAQGAGVQTGQRIVDQGAEAVIAANCGPKAFAILQAAGIKLFLVEGGRVGDLVDRLKAGDLSEADSASVEGRWV